MADDLPKDTTPPSLTQIWDEHGPSMTGDPRGMPSADPNAAPVDSPPAVRKFSVTPAALNNIGEPILQRTKTIIADYTSLKDYINENKSWIFAQHDPQEGTNIASNPLPEGKDASPTGPTHADLTATFTTASDNLLLQIGDAVELTGEYVDALNNAGQFYVRADKSSEPPSIETINLQDTIADGVHWLGDEGEKVQVASEKQTVLDGLGGLTQSTQQP